MTDSPERIAKIWEKWDHASTSRHAAGLLVDALAQLADDSGADFVQLRRAITRHWSMGKRRELAIRDAVAEVGTIDPWA